MSAILLNEDVLAKKLYQVHQRLNNPTELTAALERVLVSHTLQNFHANGRPAWAGLSPVTLEIYRRQGHTPKGILQKSGALRDSIQGTHDNNSATVQAGSGASNEYAAIHQFGGMAGRNRKVRIKARGYLPMDKNGYLQGEAEEAVEVVAGHYWQLIFN